MIEFILSHLQGPFKQHLVPIICQELKVEASTVEQVLAGIASGNGTAEQHEAIKRVVEVFNVLLLKKYGISITSGVADVENQKSARNLALQTKSKIPEILSILITLGFFSVIGIMLFNESRPNETLLIMLGSLGTAWAAVVNFWFGSSSGSMYKSEILEKITSK